MSQTKTSANEIRLFKKINADLLNDVHDNLTISEDELEIIRSRFNERAEHWRMIYNDIGNMSKPGLSKACMEWMNSIKLDEKTLFFFPDSNNSSDIYVYELFDTALSRESMKSHGRFTDTPLRDRYLFVAVCPFPCNAAIAFHHILSDFASRNGLYKEFKKKVLSLTRKRIGNPGSLSCGTDSPVTDRFYANERPDYVLPLTNTISKQLITLSECIYYSIGGYSYLDPFPVTSAMNSHQYANSLSHLKNAIDCGLEHVSVYYRTIVFTSIGKSTCDERGRPHNESGPAVKYLNGGESYYLGGVRVDKKTVEAPDSLNAMDVIKCRNQEVRRIKIERMGMEKFLADAGAKLLDTKEGINGNYELFRVDMMNDEPMVMVKVICSSTSREYFLRVPPSMYSVDEAVAWTFGLTEVEYQPVFES